MDQTTALVIMWGASLIITIVVSYAVGRNDGFKRGIDFVKYINKPMSEAQWKVEQNRK